MPLPDPSIQDAQLRDNLGYLDRERENNAALIRNLRSRVSSIETRATGANARAAGSNTTLGVSYATYLTCDVTPVGTELLVQYYFVYSNDNSGANRTITVRLQADGVDKGQTRTLDAALSGVTNRITASGTHLLTGLTAGNTYTINVDVLASATPAVSIREGELTVVEV